MTPDEIEQLFLGHPRLPDRAGQDKGSAVLQEEENLQRTESLSQVLATVRDLWETDSKDLDLIAEKIGNGVRDGEHHYTAGNYR